MERAKTIGEDDPKRVRATADELRAESHPAVAATSILMAVAWFVIVADPWKARTWLPAIAVLLLGATSLWLARRRSTDGALMLVLTLLMGIASFELGHPDLRVADYYIIPVIAAGILLGPTASATTALASTILIVGTALAAGGDPFAVEVASGVMLAWLGAILSWASSHPVYTAVNWAWTSYLDALRRAEEVRDHQGELARALSSLNETCYRLEVANRELARARAAAEEARQLKAEFAANISHELRTPLNLIIGFSEILLHAPAGAGAEAVPPAFRADLDVIYRNARHLSSLIDDVLDLSQVDAGRMGLTKERACLAEIAEEAVSAVARLYEVRGLYVRSEVPGDLPAVFVDRTRIRQVLINLLNNASRFTPRGGTTVQARCADGAVVVEVADTGLGIAPADIPKVFEEFRQLDGSTRRPHDGSGLGLAICRRFVELHGGAIWAESEVGRGTVFSFTLPLIDNVVSSPLRAEWDTWVRLPKSGDEPTKSIVLVNRDPRIERLFRRYLEGYRVIPAEEGEALRACAESGALGIVLVESPETEISELRRRLREVPRDAPVFICSLPTSVTLGERLGVGDYLVKPISRERLLDTLTRVAPKARTVLIADDDPDMVRLIARLLRSARRRYRVLRAYSGAEALAALRAQRPDVVILDLVMPEIDGYEVIREVRASDELKEVSIIAVTARSYEAETVAAGAIEITREGGLSIGDLMSCLRSSLDAITEPRDSAATPQEALAP